MKRTIRIKTNGLREELIRNVLCYHRHFTDTVLFMSNEVLLAHAHPSIREAIERRLR